jgi:CDP-glycerol glycerophosphotransferase
MKIDRYNPLHWLWLALSATWSLTALIARHFRSPHAKSRVLLYGHKLSGNLLALYRRLRSDPAFEVAFLTLDPDYHSELSQEGEVAVWAASPHCLAWLVTADALISDHGLHALRPLLGLSDLEFFDVWHGIPFKGFDGDDFRVQHKYDEVWVSSTFLRDIYINRFGFPDSIVHVTGYARTDRLVHQVEDPIAIKRRLGLDPCSGDKLVLFAPTWRQDARNRSLFPFDLNEQEFLGALSQLGRRIGATFLLRSHLNSGNVASQGFDRIVALPHAKFPDTEEILLVSDILVCDWSSIAFDYLVLDRPTVFLDVEAPFAKGLSLDAGQRFGAVVGNMDTLLERLEHYLIAPERYMQEFSAKCGEVKARVYGTYADGNATARCVARLGEHLATSGSSR